jgi:hypothetical protein
MNSRKKASKPTPETTTQAKATTRQRRFRVVKLEERIAPSGRGCAWTTLPTK